MGLGDGPLADKVNLDVQAVEVIPRRPGETGIWRNSVHPHSLYEDPLTFTLYDAAEIAFQKHGNKPCLGHRPFVGGKWGGYIWQTYNQVAERRTNFGSGILHINREVMGSNESQFKIGIYAVNRPEWMIIDQACIAYNLISVALYDTLGPDTISYITNHAELPIIACASAKIPNIIALADKLKTLKVIVSMDSLSADNSLPIPGTLTTAQALKAWGKEKNILVVDMQEVESLGKENPKPHNPPYRDDIATISYTSGTTGEPKGALISHGNFISAIRGTAQIRKMEDFDVTISYLPLAHIYGRIVDFGIMSEGGMIGYSRGDVLLLLEDIAELKPTLFFTVPRLLNRIYARLKPMLLEAPGIKGKLAATAVAVKLENLKKNGSVTHPLWDRLIFSKVQALLGGRVRLICTASAPIANDVMQFLRIAFCVSFMEGYGQTEGTATTTLTLPGETRPGHVGAPYLNVEMKLVDVPEMDYLTTDTPYPRGEILMRGESVFKGYYRDPEKTRETIDEDGWLHTGDIGLIDERGTLTIIDRKKNIFKLAQGEYIAPEKIENIYLGSTILLVQIYVHGDSLQSQLVAIVIPDPEQFIAFANAICGTSHSTTDMDAFKKICLDPMIKRALLAELDKIGRERGLRGFEFVRNIDIQTEPMTIENDLLTPTFKVKRAKAAKIYAKNIKKMYDELLAQPNAKL